MTTRAFTLIELLIVIAIIAILALIAIPNFIEAQMRAKVSRVHADMRTIATALESYFVDNNAYPRVDWRNEFDHDNRSWSKRLWFDGAAGDYSGATCLTLTTPIAYLGSRPPVDPFLEREAFGTTPYTNYSFHYYNFLDAHRHFVLWRDEWIADPDNSAGGGDGPALEMTAPAPMRFNLGHPENWEKAPVYRANWAIMSFGPDRKAYDENIAPGSSQRFWANNFLGSRVNWRNLMHGRTHIYDPTNGTVSGGNIWRLSGGSDTN